ncbi:MAG TPA: PaaI family thioesterase [Actinomycetota bacterium]
MTTPPWQEPVRGGYPDLRVFGLPAIEQARLFLQHGGPKPPLSHLTGLSFVEADEGHAAFELPASDWFLSSQEHISAGAITMLADAAVASAIFHSLPAATPMSTWELTMTFLRACPAGGTLRGVGRLLRLDRPLSLAEVWIEDGRGERVAHGTSSCFIQPPIEGVPVPDDPSIFEYVAPSYDSPDPWMRPAPGEAIPWEQWRTMSGLDILRGQIAGAIPAPPIHYLTGMTLTDVDDGRATFSMPRSEWFASPARTVQGGLIAMLGHAALATAVTSTLQVGSAYRPVDLKMHFLRPVMPGEGDLVANASVTHRGRTLAVANADVFAPDGKKVATATGSTMITGERPV